MSEEFPVKLGESATIAQLSLCVGGLIQTWTDSGPPRLWSVPDPDYLRGLQGTGTIARTLRKERRFREVGFLQEETGALIIQSRFPTPTDDGTLQVGAQVVSLGPASDANGSLYDDVRSLFTQAINHALRNSEFVVVELGGWDAPSEPFCLFIVIPQGDDFVSIVETAPAPHDSEIWRPHIVPGQPSTTLSAPASRATIEVAPMIMMDAISTWGVRPWDLTLTFGTEGNS